MPTLKPGNEKKPPAERFVHISFRPPHSVAHLVSDGENWQKLGSRYQVPVQDIITANFSTSVPEEINWYLREYVNCDTATPDRYNWRFSTSARNGPSPRAGTIFIVPNWPAIEIAARAATREFVLTWFRNAFLQGVPVVDGTMPITLGALRADAQLIPPFQHRLREGGAPDQVAKAWEFVLRRALEVFTFNLTEVRSNAFPPAAGGSRTQHLFAEPWPLLLAPSADGAVRAPFFDQIVPLSLTGDPAARKAVRRYGRWFEHAFGVLRGAAVATSVEAVGMVNPVTRRLNGSARAPVGFLTNLVMPE